MKAVRLGWGARAVATAIATAIVSAAGAQVSRVGVHSAVAEEGETRLAAGRAPAIAATIDTRRASEAEGIATRATRCSGGRVACSLVDRLMLQVNGHKVEVPPRAMLLLADVDEAELRVQGRGRYELILTCGDAAPTYQARLFFGRRRVDRLDIWSDEAGMVEQRTTFNDVGKAFR